MNHCCYVATGSQPSSSLSLHTSAARHLPPLPNIDLLSIPSCTTVKLQQLLLNLSNKSVWRSLNCKAVLKGWFLTATLEESLKDNLWLHNLLLLEHYCLKKTKILETLKIHIVSWKNLGRQTAVSYTNAVLGWSPACWRWNSRESLTEGRMNVAVWWFGHHGIGNTHPIYLG